MGDLEVFEPAVWTLKRLQKTGRFSVLMLIPEAVENRQRPIGVRAVRLLQAIETITAAPAAAVPDVALHSLLPVAVHKGVIGIRSSDIKKLPPVDPVGVISRGRRFNGKLHYH